MTSRLTRLHWLLGCIILQYLVLERMSTYVVRGGGHCRRGTQMTVGGNKGNGRREGTQMTGQGVFFNQYHFCVWYV